MATRAAAASLRAAGASARGGRGGGVPVFGYGGGSTGPIYGHQALARAPTVEAAARGGGKRSFFSLLKGRWTNSEITKGPVNKQQLQVESGTESPQNWKVLELQVELKTKKSLSKQRKEYDSKLTELQKDIEMRFAEIKKEFDGKITTAKARQEEAFKKIAEVETAMKLWSLKLESIQENWKGSMDTIQFNMLKGCLTFGTVALGAAVSYFKISEYFMKLRTYKAREGDLPWLEFVEKDWFD